MIHLIFSLTYCILKFVIMILFEDINTWFLENLSIGIFICKFIVFNSGNPVVFSANINTVILFIVFFFSSFRWMKRYFAELSFIPHFPNHNWNQKPFRNNLMDATQYKFWNESVNCTRIIFWHKNFCTCITL